MRRPEGEPDKITSGPHLVTLSLGLDEPNTFNSPSLEGPLGSRTGKTTCNEDARLSSARPVVVLLNDATTLEQATCPSEATGARLLAKMLPSLRDGTEPLVTRSQDTRLAVRRHVVAVHSGLISESSRNCTKETCLFVVATDER